MSGVEDVRRAIAQSDEYLREAPFVAAKEYIEAADPAPIIQLTGELINKVTAWRTALERAKEQCNELDIATSMAALGYGEVLAGADSRDAHDMHENTIIARGCGTEALKQLNFMDGDSKRVQELLGTVALLISANGFHYDTAIYSVDGGIKSQAAALQASERYKETFGNTA